MVVEELEKDEGHIHFVYEDQESLWDKIRHVAQKVYGAKDISAEASLKKKIERLQKKYGHFPVCLAKTQYSFSTNEKLRGAPEDHVIELADVYLSRGAGFLVVLCGAIMTMPGLPKVPSAERIDLTQDGEVVGLF